MLNQTKITIIKPYGENERADCCYWLKKSSFRVPFGWPRCPNCGAFILWDLNYYK
ncbi:MAG: hypothetical protein ACOC56_03580 [Atribacterota bacterium]